MLTRLLAARGTVVAPGSASLGSGSDIKTPMQLNKA
jgi:hypothetical protein